MCPRQIFRSHQRRRAACLAPICATVPAGICLRPLNSIARQFPGPPEGWRVPETHLLCPRACGHRHLFPLLALHEQCAVNDQRNINSTRVLNPLDLPPWCLVAQPIERMQNCRYNLRLRMHKQRGKGVPSPVSDHSDTDQGPSTLPMPVSIPAAKKKEDQSCPV